MVMETPRGSNEPAPVTSQRPYGWTCSTCGEVVSRGFLVNRGKGEEYWEREKERRVYPAGREHTPEIMWGGIGWRVTGSLMCKCGRDAIAWGVEKMGLAENEPWPEPGDPRWKLLRPVGRGGPVARAVEAVAEEIA
jgi:hypothetical protein